ncbi:MAG: Spy/CpxP family protein refolding chaperone, partial [Pseudomonadota bacterium]|nr:Spy/CpxP family protein refolding chaperone [Pseudomonadota bacterium]
AEAMVTARGSLTRRHVQWVMMGMLMTLLAAIGLSAWAQPAPTPEMDGRPGMEHRMGGGMRHGGMHRHMGPGMMFRGSPEQIGRGVDFMLDGLDATDAQRGEIKQIAVQAAGELRAQAQAGKGLHQRGMQIFTAPTVDAAAAEQLRQQMLQQHDQMSRRVTQAMLDVARVLTPEQRAIIGQRMHDRQARMEDRMKRMSKEAPRR